MSRNSTSASGLPECHFAVFRLGNGWEALEGIRLPQQLQSQVFLADSCLPDGDIKSESSLFQGDGDKNLCKNLRPETSAPLLWAHVSLGLVFGQWFPDALQCTSQSEHPQVSWVCQPRPWLCC